MLALGKPLDGRHAKFFPLILTESRWVPHQFLQGVKLKQMVGLKQELKNLLVEWKYIARLNLDYNHMIELAQLMA